jgi:hypothetical protein
MSLTGVASKESGRELMGRVLREGYGDVSLLQRKPGILTPACHRQTPLRGEGPPRFARLVIADATSQRATMACPPVTLDEASDLNARRRESDFGVPSLMAQK